MQASLQFKRGTLAEWSTINPVLTIGQPGYVTDSSYYGPRLKIGDGKTPWNDLPFDGTSIIEVNSGDFPNIGRSDVIYKDKNTGKLYHFDGVYKPLAGSDFVNDFNAAVSNIKIISGGDAADMINK